MPDSLPPLSSCDRLFPVFMISEKTRYFVWNGAVIVAVHFLPPFNYLLSKGLYGNSIFSKVGANTAL